MINLITIARQLASFIRQYSPLSVEEMCPITLSILCYRFASYDMVKETKGIKDPWKDLLTNLEKDNEDTRYIIRAALLEGSVMFTDRQMPDLYYRAVQEILRIPRGGFCGNYIYKIDECTKDYCAPGYREGLFEEIMHLHGGRRLELVPWDVCSLISRIVRKSINNKKDLRLYDPSCGVGTLAMSVLNRNSDIVSTIILRNASMLQSDMARLNMFVNGINQYDLKNEDVLSDEWFLTERYNVITCLPPWGVRRRIEPIKWKNLSLRYPRYKELPFDNGFMLRCLESLTEDGVMALAVPLSLLYQLGVGEDIRRQIIAHNDLRAVIGLPVNMLYSTSVAFALMVFQHSDKRNGVLMINAKNLFENNGRLNRLSLAYQNIIIRCYSSKDDVSGLSRLVPYEEIANNKYSLLPSQYVTNPIAEQQMISDKIGEINKLVVKMKDIVQEHNVYLRQLGLPELDV